MEVLAVAIRFGLYLDLALNFGIAAFALYALRGEERRSGAVLPLIPVACATALAGVLLSGAGLLATTASMAGTDLLAPDRATLEILLNETPIGVAWFVRSAALTASAIAAVCLRPRPFAAAVASMASSAVALATLAWGGHGAMQEGSIGMLHLTVDIGHLLAAGLWIGALASFFLLLLLEPCSRREVNLQLLHRALQGFGIIGTLAVAMLVATGVGNALLVIGLDGVTTLPFTLYGQLLIAKLGLFGIMLLLAATNRFRLTPAFERALEVGAPKDAVFGLRRSLAVEALAGTAILAAVAWMGTLDPLPGV